MVVELHSSEMEKLKAASLNLRQRINRTSLFLNVFSGHVLIYEGRTTLNEKSESKPAPKVKTPWYPQFKKDYRTSLPTPVARFIGFRPHAGPLYKPIWPLKWFNKFPLVYETYLIGWIGAFVSVVLIEAVMSSSALFKSYEVPLIIASFGASAVLVCEYLVFSSI